MTLLQQDQDCFADGSPFSNSRDFNSRDIELPRLRSFGRSDKMSFLSQIDQQKQQNTTTMNTFNIKDSVAFVTGTNKKNGIGRSIVEALLSNGAAKVYATARDTSQLEDLVVAYNGKVVAVSLDVTDLEAIKLLPTKFPDVTIVVNNAGYMGCTSSLGDIDAIRKEIEVNYIAPMAIVKSFAPILEKVEGVSNDSKPTAVVNINSIGGFVNLSLTGTYSASKSASHSLTQAQRCDLPDSLVVGVYPGPIDTDMGENFPMEKTPPIVVAQQVVDALRNGTEDVFPDVISQQLHEGWKADAKALQIIMTSLSKTRTLDCGIVSCDKLNKE
jgi:NAD(P)-dependent dehydrogenase (short-subunit alcohol dehydrogenase family)